MFKKEKICVIKKALPVYMVNFLNKYFQIKEQAAIRLYADRQIPEGSPEWGTHMDNQVNGSYSIYGDQAADTLLVTLQPIFEKAIKQKLVPTYSYTRVYKKGAILEPHKDRLSCDISTTLCLGGDPWLFWYKKGNKKCSVDLKPGDMLAYRGTEIEHWREPFEGKECVQSFLHYNSAGTELAEKNIYDGRPCLGLPGYYGQRIENK
jgi:hypothetical protein